MRNLIHPRLEATVLIVDDDDSIRELLQELLESEGYKTQLAVNGQDGLDKLRALPNPCLVLLDMMMPIKSGRDFLDEVAKDPRLSKIPVIVLSASASPQDAAGARILLKKPQAVENILKTISEHYDCQNLRPSSKIDLEISPNGA